MTKDLLAAVKTTQPEDEDSLPDTAINVDQQKIRQIINIWKNNKIKENMTGCQFFL